MIYHFAFRFAVQVAYMPMMNNILPIAPTPMGPRVVALVYDGLCTFEFAIAAEVFGLARPEMGPDWYRFAACGVEPGPYRAHGGLRVEVDGGTELLTDADVIIVPGWRGAGAPVPGALVDHLQAAHSRGARLASICSGAFVLAATGLLDGRRAATHWRYADALQAAYPKVWVDSSVLYVEEGQLLTSAGSAAGIDLMLHVIRSDFGAEAANSVARRLVVPPHRNGGQAQFIERPVAVCPHSKLTTLLDKMRADVTKNWTIPDMAHALFMSERTLVRRFKETTGLAPGKWLIGIKVEEARRLLEQTSYTVEEVARCAGFGSVATLRHHFTPTVGLPPRDYRERFRHRNGKE